MHLFGLLAIVYISYCSIAEAHPSLNHQFHRFQILTARHLKVRTKRWAQSDQRFGNNYQKHLTFSLFGRKVSLSITAGLLDRVVIPGASIQYVDGDNSRSDIQLDPDDFHEGSISGHETGSYVHAIKHRNNWLIHAEHSLKPHLSFSIEPLSLYTSSLPYSNPANRRRHRHKMVAYLHKDIRVFNKTGDSYCKTFNHDQLRSRFPKYFQKEEKKENAYSSQQSQGKENQKHDQNPQRNPLNIVDSHIHTQQSLNSTEEQPVVHYTEKDVGRNRRDTASTTRRVVSRDICDILAIADFPFYYGVGEQSVIQTAKLLISIYDTVRYSFQDTDFSPWGYNKSVGVLIGGMQVFTNPEVGRNLSKALYMDNELVGGDVVKELTANSDYLDYCIVHLSTQRTFGKRVLGLAITAKPLFSPIMLHGTQYGICSKDKLNVGISTVNFRYEISSFLAYRLVVLHEVGHNFGANHDTRGRMELGQDCSPKERDGGRFVMWENNNKGYSKNNIRFSPCSRKEMATIIKNRNHCFLSKDALKYNLCGNGRLDLGEDCDIGLSFRLQDDTGCCSPNCRFTPGSICSPYNHPCCENCTVAPKDSQCSGESKEWQCSKPGVCDGKSHYTCTNVGAKANGTPCQLNGECHSGKCIDFCRLEGRRRSPSLELRPCVCDSNPKDMCTVCCHTAAMGDIPPGKCVGMGVSYPNDTPCDIGVCQRGVCQSIVQNVKWLEQKAQAESVERWSSWQIALLVVTVTVVVAICGVLITILYFANLQTEPEDPNSTTETPTSEST